MYKRKFTFKLKDLAKPHAPMGYLIYAGDREQKILSIELLNYKRSILAIPPAPNVK